MYKIILEKNLPFTQDGFNLYKNFICTDYIKVFYFLKNSIIFKKKIFIVLNKINKKTKNFTPIQIELNFIKNVFFWVSTSKKKISSLMQFDLIYNLFLNLNLLSNNLNIYVFGIEVLLLNKHEELRLYGSKLLEGLIKIHGVYNILTFLQIKMNHKNKNIRMIASTTLSTIKKYKVFNILNPFLRCLFIFKKKWRIQYSICKTIQNLIKNSTILSFYEREEFIFLGEKCLKNYKNIIITNGIKIISFLIEKYKNDSIYLPCLISPIFDGLRKYKSNIFLFYLKAAKVFLKKYFLKLPFLLLIEFIDIILRFRKKNNLINLCSIKTLSLCFKKKATDKRYLKKTTFFVFTSVLNSIIPFSRNTKTHAHLNALISLSKKNIIKKILFFILLNFFKKNFYFFNNILRLIRGLLFKYYKKKKLSFTLISSIFIQILGLVDGYSLRINADKIVTLELCHRILETIVNNFKIYSSYFLPQLSNTLKWELKINKSIFKKQAAITLKNISNNLNPEEKNFIYEFSVILFENLKDLEPYNLSRNIIAINSLLKGLNINEYIPPPDILILEFTSILKNRKKVVLKSLSKSIWIILKKNFLFLPKSQMANIALRLIKVSKSFDLITKKYCICSVYKIADTIGPIEMINMIINEYNQNNKSYRFSQITLFALFFEMFGCQVIPQIFSYFFYKINLETKIIAIKNLMYITWYLPNEKIKYFFNLFSTILEKISKKNNSNNIYILLGLLSKKSKNKVSYIDLNKLLLNIWSDIFKINKPIFKYIFFAIQKMCKSIESIYLKLFISQGLFHPNYQIRKIYWYIYFNIKINLSYLVMFCTNKRIKTI
nr:splicing factor 3B subunit 1-like protein [Cryptomonas curvata]